MTKVTENMRVAIEDPDAQAFRKGICEWLMVNHPHDCPVCDEGGHCHLQDMTVMTGHDYRRFRFKKRTFTNQNLGPFINHEMNRCITCYRCVRFYRDYAGGNDLEAMAAASHVYFGRSSDGHSKTISAEIWSRCARPACSPTRPWPSTMCASVDLQTAPSVCVHCSVGCNIIASERAGVVRQIVNRYNSQVNGYFICDRGRFGYGFVNSPQRLQNALVWHAVMSQERETLPPEAALQWLKIMMSGAYDPWYRLAPGFTRSQLRAARTRGARKFLSRTFGARRSFAA